MIKVVGEILFYGLILLLAAYSIIMIFVLLRFGKSKILGLILAAFYLILMLSLYAAASVSFAQIPFPEI